MTEFDFVRNDTDTGYTTNWVNTATFGHELTEKVGGYVELATTLTRGAASSAPARAISGASLRVTSAA